MEDTAVETVSPEQEAASMSFVQRLSGVFFEPIKTFRDINLKPTWICMLVVLLIISAVHAYFVNTRIDIGAVTQKTIKSMHLPIPQEQIDAMAELEVAKQHNIPAQMLKLAIVVIAGLAGMLIMAAVFLLIYSLMGAPLKYKKSLAISVWSVTPPTIVQQVISIIILLIKEPNSIDSQEIVVANLGPLVDSKAHSVLNSLLSSVDLFSIWMIILLSLGYAAISEKKLTPKKASMGILIPWILFVLIKLGYRAIAG